MPAPKSATEEGGGRNNGVDCHRNNMPVMRRDQLRLNRCHQAVAYELDLLAS